MSDMMQDWLCGRKGASHKVDYYAEEREEIKQGLHDNLCEADAYCPAEGTPYNRSYTDPVDLDLVYECLDQMFCTHEPLPKVLTLELMRDIELLKSRREGQIFRHGKNPTAHPDELYMRGLVIRYVELARETGLDDKPMKTIDEQLGIGSSTYYEWKRKVPVTGCYPEATDDELKQAFRSLWGALVKHFTPPPE